MNYEPPVSRASLLMLARYLSGMYDLKLREGRPAIHLQKKVMYLPKLPIVSDSIIALYADRLFTYWVYHEASGHGIFSSPETFDHYDSTLEAIPFLHSLFMCLEDPRIEQGAMTRSPSAEQAIRDGIRQMSVSGLIKSGQKDFCEAISMYVLNTLNVRWQGFDFLSALLQKQTFFLLTFDGVSQDWLDELDAWVFRARNQTHSDGVMYLACQILNWMTDTLPQNLCEELFNAPPQSESEVEQSLSGVNIVVKELEDRANDPIDASVIHPSEVCIDQHGYLLAEALPDVLDDLRLRMPGGLLSLRNQIALLIKSLLNTKKRTAQSGQYLSKKHLSRVAMRDPRIWVQRNRSDIHLASVSLLLDMSHSMEVLGFIDDTVQAAVALGDALNVINADFEVMGYGAEDSKAKSQGCVFKPFDEPWQASQSTLGSFSALAGGSTPILEAIQDASKRISQRPAHRRVILVMTDGDLNPVDSDYFDPLRKQGIEVIGIGLKQDVSHVFTEHVTVDCVEDLGEAFLQLLSNKVAYAA